MAWEEASSSLPERDNAGAIAPALSGSCFSREPGRLLVAGQQFLDDLIGDPSIRRQADRFLEALQGVGALHTHPRLAKVHGSLSERVHFPREPPRDGERDVRSSDRGGLATERRAASKSSLFAGPTPRFSSCSMNSRNRASLRACRNDRIMNSP